MTAVMPCLGRSLFRLAVLLFGLLTQACAEGVPLILSANMQHVSLEGRLEHFADPSGSLSFEAVQQENFVRLKSFRSQGYDNAVHWYRFDLGHATDAPSSWILTIGTLMLDEVDVSVVQPDGGFQRYDLGDHRPYGDRQLQTHLFAVPLEVSAQTRVYLKIRSTSSINVSAELWRPEAFTAEETRTNFNQGLYFGILLIVAIFYAILAAWSRDAILAAYAAYVASLIPLHMGYNGYLPLVFASATPETYDAVWRIAFLAGIVIMIFMWTRLMELRQNFPLIHRLYQAAALFSIALIPLVTTSVYQVFTPYMNFVAISLSAATLALLGTLWWRLRRIELMLYFIAFLIPAVGVVLQALVAMGGLPNNALTIHAYQITSLIHVLVMSVGLALRLRQMNNDKAMAEQEAIVATRRAEEQRHFVAMLSHEFRNPLAAIDRAAQMIQIKTADLASPEAQRLDQIRRNATTLASFVDNFLKTEALDHGALALSRELCPIRPLLEATIGMLGDAAAERIHLAVTPDDAAFDLDPTMIGIAVGNLLGNALRYSPPDSPIEVVVSLNNAGLHLRVTDHGPGLSEEELNKLGMPYYRAASSLGKQGSGLGYHFTQRIVQAHGGKLTASSRPGCGLEVEMYLP